MINKDEIQRIISSLVEIPEDFIIGEIYRKPNVRGCTIINGAWYIYRVDDWGGCRFTGPFSDRAIIFACAIKLHAAKSFEDYKFSEEEKAIFIHTHLLYEEI